MPLILFAFGLAATVGSAWMMAGPWWALAAALILSLAFGDVALAAWVNRRVPAQTGPDTITGLRGIVLETAAASNEPGWSGRVRIRGETWKAYAREHTLNPGDSIRVISVQGLWLYVVREGAVLAPGSDEN